MKKSSNKRYNILFFILAIGVILLINFIGGTRFTRIDLTEEKIHTLTPNTIELLENDSIIQNEVRIEIYLEGDEFPSEITKLQQAIKEKLDEFRAYAPNKISYEFINPIANPKTAQELEKQLKEFGLLPAKTIFIEKGAKKDILFYPGALLRYDRKTIPIQFLPGYRQIQPREINEAINQLEYQFLAGFSRATSIQKQKLAFIQGHNELNEEETWNITQELNRFYTTESVDINSDLDALKTFDAAIIAKPKQPFTDGDMFVIDQFIMNGGKVAWLIDPMNPNEDTLLMRGQTMGLPYDLKIDEQLFKYGVRLNNDLVLDKNCGPIQIPGYQDLAPWYFHPIILNSKNGHPITNNLDPIKLKYTSSIESVGNNSNIKKTPILNSSKSSTKYQSPARISYAMTNFDPTNTVNSKEEILGFLLEGQFESFFKNRIAPNSKDGANYKFKESSPETKMVVIADGDIIKDRLERDPKTGRTLKISPDWEFYTQEKRYANTTFFANTIDFLLGNKFLISLRGRKISMRPLNYEKVANEGSRWKSINVVLPILLIILLGIGKSFYRKNRYAKA